MVIFNTDHKQGIVFQSLFNKIVVFTLVLEFTVYPFVPILLDRIGQRNRDSKYKEILR